MHASFSIASNGYIYIYIYMLPCERRSKSTMDSLGRYGVEQHVLFQMGHVGDRHPPSTQPCTGECITN